MSATRSLPVPPGAGKSTLLNLLACQWLRYPGARVYIFDKGASCRAMTLAMGGDFFDLGGEGDEICFQPLAGSTMNRNWPGRRIGWRTAAPRKGGSHTGDKAGALGALSNLASMPRVQRTLSTLLGIVQDADVRQAMRSYTLDGPHGRLLDANQIRWPTMAVNMNRAGRRSRWNT
jgi:type IV secretory pathway VirB4 component